MLVVDVVPPTPELALFAESQVALTDPSKLMKSVIVDRLCGEAVLRGADIFVRGVLTATFGVIDGDEVAIWADLGDEVRRGGRGA